MVVRVIESSSSRLRFEADGQKFVLAPIVAANVAVVPISKHATRSRSFERLSDLKISQRGKVVGISPACRGPQLRRLLDLGLVPGTVVEAELPSPGGDPTAYRVRGALIALRKDQARMVYINRAEENVA
jgi:DtxR family Mn-dependent transcriptional regulator